MGRTTSSSVSWLWMSGFAADEVDGLEEDGVDVDGLLEDGSAMVCVRWPLA